MSYDLMIGKSFFVKDKPLIVGSIEDDDYHALAAIAKRHPSWLLDRLLNVFDDQSFGMEELQLGIEILDALAIQERGSKECGTIYKIFSIFSMALRRGMPLHGVAD